MIRTDQAVEIKQKKFDKYDTRYKTERFAEGTFYKTSKNMVAILGWDLAGVLTNLIDQYNLWLTYDKCKDGGFFCTIEKQARILRFTEDKIRKCKKILTEMELIRTVMKGLPPKEYYYVDMDKFEEMEREYIKNVPPENERVNPAENGINYPAENVSDIYNKNKINKNKINKNISTKVDADATRQPEISSVNMSNSIPLKRTIHPEQNIKKVLSARQKSPKKLSDAQIKAIEQNKVVNQFAEFMKEKRNIHMSKNSKEDARIYHISHLEKHKQVELARMSKVIDWLFIHCDDEYVPSITSIQEFCFKFAKLEAAMKRQADSKPNRNNPGFVGQDKEQKTYVDFQGSHATDINQVQEMFRKGQK